MTARRIRQFLLSAASATLIASSTIALGAQDVVEIRLRGRYFSEPATIHVTVAVEPDAKNRSLVIVADGDRLFRSSEIALDGDKGQRIHTMQFKNLPAGHYILRAEVRSGASLRGAAEEQLTVGGLGDEQQ